MLSCQTCPSMSQVSITYQSQVPFPMPLHHLPHLSDISHWNKCNWIQQSLLAPCWASACPLLFTESTFMTFHTDPATHLSHSRIGSHPPANLVEIHPSDTNKPVHQYIGSLPHLDPPLLASSCLSPLSLTLFYQLFHLYSFRAKTLLKYP